MTILVPHCEGNVSMGKHSAYVISSWEILLFSDRERKEIKKNNNKKQQTAIDPSHSKKESQTWANVRSRVLFFFLFFFFILKKKNFFFFYQKHPRKEAKTKRSRNNSSY